MKVVLRENVPNLGPAGAIVDVTVGYARNFLLPRHLALEPNQANLKRVEHERGERRKHDEARLASLKELAARIGRTSVTVKAKANELGHLFGSITEKHIADALAAEGLKVDPTQVALAAPIRTLDKFRVPVRLADGVEAEVDVWVVPE